jgi:hypothetical protein
MLWPIVKIAKQGVLVLVSKEVFGLRRLR